MDEVKKVGVYKAISKVTGMMAMEGISKNRRNQQQGYAFRGIDDVYNVLSGMLAEVGLCIIPRVLSRHMAEKQTKSGAPLFYVVVEVEYDLVSAEDGSSHIARVIGEAMDSADKATNKAMSAAYKYMAFQTFAIPTEGDNDADAHTPEVKPANAPPTPAEKKALVAKAKAAIRGEPAPLPAEAPPADGKPDVDTMRKLVAAFASIGYDIPAFEAEYGKNLDDFTAADIPEARELFNHLRDKQKSEVV